MDALKAILFDFKEEISRRLDEFEKRLSSTEGVHRELLTTTSIEHSLSPERGREHVDVSPEIKNLFICKLKQTFRLSFIAFCHGNSDFFLSPKDSSWWIATFCDDLSTTSISDSQKGTLISSLSLLGLKLWTAWKLCLSSIVKRGVLHDHSCPTQDISFPLKILPISKDESFLKQLGFADMEFMWSNFSSDTCYEEHLKLCLSSASCKDVVDRFFDQKINSRSFGGVHMKGKLENLFFTDDEETLVDQSCSDSNLIRMQRLLVFLGLIRSKISILKFPVDRLNFDSLGGTFPGLFWISSEENILLTLSASDSLDVTSETSEVYSIVEIPIPLLFYRWKFSHFSTVAREAGVKLLDVFSPSYV